MKRNTRTIAATLLLGFLMRPFIWAVAAPETLFQDAMMKETGERDLDAAIALYQKVIERAGTNHLLVAKAQLRMGGCYERLGKNKEAEKVYRDIISDPASSQGEIAQLAQDSLQRLETLKRKQASWSVEYTHVYQETPARFSLGTAFISTREGLRPRLSLALRYPLFKPQEPRRPQVLWIEWGMIPPMGALEIQARTEIPDTSTSDIGTLNLLFQTHLALVAELPHGSQRTIVPEIGVGAALTRAEIEYTSVVTGASPSTTSGQFTENNLGPYFASGLHFYPDRVVSFLLSGRYSYVPFPKSVQIATPGHRATFGFADSLWNVTAELQVKVGWFKRVPKTK